MSESGHGVLLIPVPALECFVRARWEHYDAAWTSRDPEFTHAHITALAPYLSAPAPEDLALVGAIAAATPAFDFELSEISETADGNISLRPDPVGPFARLTGRLVEAFPQCPPYDGRYDALPHLTLDRRSATVTVASTRALLGEVLPAHCRADRLELHWYEAGRCHVRLRWLLGVSEPARLPRVGPHTA